MNKRLMKTALALSLIASSCSSGTDDVKKYGLELPFKEGFKIVWVTDFHYGQNASKEIQFAFLKKMIEEASSPDLMVFTGDTFWEETKDDCRDLITYIDSFNIKWAFTFGNHDLESFKEEDKYFINELINGCINQVFIDFEDDSLTGRTNYYIDLKDGKKTVYRLYILDSNAEADNGGYDIIHEEQLTHLQKIYKAEGDSVPGLVFTHIPIFEYAYAYPRFKLGELAGQGENREKCCCGYTDSGAYKVFKDIGVIGVFSGHDHLNDSDIAYKKEDDEKGMVLSYGLKSSDQDYGAEDMRGYKTIVLPSDADKFSYVSIESHFCSYE